MAYPKPTALKSYKYILAALFLSINIFCQAQSGPFKKLGNDLPYPALDACFSKVNQLHAICASPDTLFAYAFDSIANKWIMKARLPYNNEIYNRYAIQSARCFFLDTNFFMTVSGNKDTTTIYKKNNKGFSVIGKLHNTNPGFPTPDFFVRSIDIYNNTAFLTGKFAKVLNGPNLLGIVKFDGTNLTFVNVDMTWYWGTTNLTHLRNDTLFVPQPNGIHAYHIPSGSLTSYFSTSQNISTITGSKNSIFYMDESRKIYEVRKNKVIDSLKPLNFYDASYTNYHDLYYVKGKLVDLANLAYGRQELYIRNGNTFKGLRTPDFKRDYNPENIQHIAIISDKYNQQYLISNADREYNNVKLNLPKFNLDSLQPFGFDSIYLQTFGDNDRNGKLSAGDTAPNMGFYTINDEFIFSDYGGTGFLKAIMPDYRTYGFRSYFDYFDPSCYRMPTKGKYTTNNLLPGKTKDTLIFPLVLQSGASNPLVYLRGADRARLNDTVSNSFFITDNGCNQGNSTAYAKVILHSKTIFISSQPAYTSRTGDTLFYKTDSINNNTRRSVTFKTSYSNVDFKIGDTAIHRVLLCKNLKGNKPLYDLDSSITRLVYSYDPNEKVAQPGGAITSDVDKLRYTIHFQNEGNDDAEDITITDTLDSRLTPNSINVIDASHAYTFAIRNNIITWQFKDINLVPKSTNDTKSRGYVVFEADKNKVLKIGDSLRNKASIFFDLNAPIITNYAVVKMVEKKKDTTIISVTRILSGMKSVSIFPNPAEDIVNLVNHKNEDCTISLMDITGKEILNFSLKANSSQKINTADLSRSIYFITVQGTGECHKLIMD